MGHWKKTCFLHSSPKGKDGLCTDSFNEKLGQPLLAYLLDIWSDSGFQCPFLSFCRGFAQPFLLCITSPTSKAQGPTRKYADLNQKCPGAHDHCNTFKLPCTGCPNTLHKQLTPDTNLSQILPPSSSSLPTHLLVFNLNPLHSFSFLPVPCPVIE